MFTKFTETYGNLENKQEIPSNDLAQVKSTLTPELYELLEQGEGSYMNGFLWIVNLVEYVD
ncbi:hypothetical protein [Pedobacter rhodius]|uniref:Uncharacterized protein n=1 Tax=Pedobacter rhodius TaxID=3004098 RepID=A0ABT4KYH2_9SPHI|nr:hypothetical protein [Pedobacter sp. SJ11]MCZ4223985.1 hypothetical protein [Pedobacter sp. SJ11]